VFTHYFRLTHRGEDSRHRCRLLERLLARAAAPERISNWRVDAFRVIAPAGAFPGVGAAALCAAGGTADGSVFMATPVHYVAEMNNVRLASDGILRLSSAEALTLCDDFNRVWAGAGNRLTAGASGELFCVIDGSIAAATKDPEDALGLHIADYLPSAGADAPRLRQLMSEIEMWLFEHPVNLARRASAAPDVSGLWLWGGGPGLKCLPPIEGWTAGDDPLFKAWAARPESQSGAPAPAVIVIGAAPGTVEWQHAESRWLLPSAADLDAGRIARLQLSAGNRCYSVGRRRRWRFLRRRPWWESFA
jgi:hypothetical protein